MQDEYKSEAGPQLLSQGEWVDMIDRIEELDGVDGLDGVEGLDSGKTRGSPLFIAIFY